MSDKLENFLEEVKAARHYSVSCWYGEGTGVDDLDVPQSRRRIKIIAVPTGHLGEVKRVWVGLLDEILQMDPTAAPIQLPNPPEEDPANQGPGSYAWGTDSAMVSYMRKFGVFAEDDERDWKYEVNNGDTRLGLVEWVAQRDAAL